MFVGESRHSVDAKKRVFLPKRFQHGLALDDEGNRVAILTRGLDGCLFLFSEEGFARALKRLPTAAFAGRDQRALQRRFFSNTSRVNLDSSGRLLLPEKLRTLAGIAGEVVMVGVVDRIELWSGEQWDALGSGQGDGFEDDLENFLEDITGASGPGGGDEA